MKFDKPYYKLVISLIFVILTLSSKLTSCAEMKAKLLSALSSKNQLKLQAQTLNTLKSTSKMKNEYSFQNFYGEPPAPTKTNGNKATSILEDWLMISSKVFKNTSIFPEVLVTPSHTMKIKSDANDFRLNDVFGKDDNKENQPVQDNVFWFRLRPENIFYSSTKSDTNILGGIRIDHIDEIISKNSDPTGVYCFVINDTSGFNWKICSTDVKIRNKWICEIQKMKKKDQESFCKNDDQDNEKIKVITKEVIQPMIIVPIPSRNCNQDWTYQNHGEDWECDCSEGKEQSPIDLPIKDKAIETKDFPLFKFSEVDTKDIVSITDGKVRATETIKLQLKDNSLRVQAKFGKTVTPDGSVYDAEELIIHSPSEHKIDGKGYDMEIQIVHNGKSKGDIGRQLILSFLFEKQPGVYNKFIDDLDFFNLPNPLSPIVDITRKLNIAKIFYNSDDTEDPKMKPFSIYSYQGSLTAPPCTEDTIIYVTSKPIPLSSTALHLFQEALRVPDLITEKGDVVISDKIAMSNRNVQPINGRPVFHFNHENLCGPDKPKKTEDDLGHYEKINKVSTKFFFVPGNKVSGVPNAFLVSKDEAMGTPAHKP